MTVNYQETGVDLDFVYINANDVQYLPLEALNISGRKVVVVGQNYQTNYPTGNVGSAFTLSVLDVPKIDSDSTDVVGVLPTAVIYQNKNYPNQTQIRGQFSLVENYPQTNNWLLVNSHRSSPAQLGNVDETWKEIQAGWNHSAVRKPNGWYTFGENATYTELATPNAGHLSSPTQVFNSFYWTNINFGQNHFVGIQTGGTLWTAGRNNTGQFGNNSSLPSTSAFPIQIAPDKSWTKCSSGAFFNFALNSNGTLWGWGRNNSYELGNSTTVNLSSMVQITSYTWNDIACGPYYSIAIKSDGTLWSWGANAYGQLGNNTTATSTSPTQIATTYWNKVSTGNSHVLALKDDGTIWSWGYNAYGQLGSSNTTNRSSRVQIGTDLWKKISCGYNHSIAIQSNGTLWAWGYNVYGQLGLGDTTDRYSPVQIGSSNQWENVVCGSYHTIAIDSSGKVFCFGYNAVGCLGLKSSGLQASKLDYGL